MFMQFVQLFPEVPPSLFQPSLLTTAESTHQRQQLGFTVGPFRLRKKLIGRHPLSETVVGTCRPYEDQAVLHRPPDNLRAVPDLS